MALSKEERLALLEAMYHLEVVTSPEAHVCGDEATKRSWASHYLIQLVVTGHKPDNFWEVVAEARVIDVLRNVMS